MNTSANAEQIAKLRGQRETKLRSSEELKAVRTQLTNSSTIKPEFEYELLTLFVRNEMSAAVTMPALSVIFSLASMFWAPAQQGMSWLLIVILSKVLLLELCRRFLATNRDTIDVFAWRRRFILAELLNGISWAGFALVGTATTIAVTGNAATFSSHVFLFATLIVLLAIRMTFAATTMTILCVGTIPMTIAVAGRLLLLDDPFYFALASMAVGVHIYFIFLAKGLQSTAIAMLEFRAQKDTLIAALEEEKLVSDEARRRAETDNNAKSRFLATMSHELRTPLNAIMGFSEVMKSELLGPHGTAVYRDYSENIHESGKHLLHLINEILDLSRIEAGRYELHESNTLLADIADDCHRLLRLKAQNKGVELVENYADNLPPIWADHRAFLQVCLNLMSNALKFTPKGGSVTVTIAASDDGGQMLSIKDTGPGIPQHELGKVLQAFGQGSLAHHSAEGGSGLGLAIVQSLVELHQAKFELKSELRQGTEAIVWIPKSRVLSSAELVEPPRPQQQPAVSTPARTGARSPRQPHLIAAKTGSASAKIALRSAH